MGGRPGSHAADPDATWARRLSRSLGVGRGHQGIPLSLESLHLPTLTHHILFSTEGLHGPVADLHLLCCIPYSQPLVSQGPVDVAQLRIILQSMR